MGGCKEWYWILKHLASSIPLQCAEIMRKGSRQANAKGMVLLLFYLLK